MREKLSRCCKGFSALELVLVITAIVVLVLISGPQLVMFQKSSKMAEEKSRLAAEYTALKLQQLESDPTKFNEILAQMSTKYPDFRVPTISQSSDPKQTTSDVKIGILEYRISNLEKANKEVSNSQPSWWILLLVIPGISAMMGRLLNPLFDFLGAHLKTKTQEALEKKT